MVGRDAEGGDLLIMLKCFGSDLLTPHGLKPAQKEISGRVSADCSQAQESKLLDAGDVMPC